jgi:Tfp pilus assembly protein PilF
VCDRYRNLLDGRPNDARCLNNLAALLLSSSQPKEGRRYALLALAADPNNANSHQNLAIADVYCFIAPIHKVPADATESSSFLVAYFDPHAH